MPLESHHKKIIISVSSLVIAFMVTSSIFMYLIFTKQTTEFNELNKKIEDLSRDTQAKINDLSDSVLETESGLKSIGSQIGSLDKELTTLKASASSDFSSVIEDAIKSVVTIKTDVAQGSGFVIAAGGYIVTNAHVMEDATAANIITYDGKSHKVSRIGENPTMDITLLRIDDESYAPLILADSNEVEVGEKVIAIGNPLGLQFSVSEGIVSAIGREGSNKIKAYIQTDAALNSGNSGGPLINKEGEVVGINNFKIGDSENLGFALESNYIREVVNDISQQAYSADLI
jgi:S1-C subfamily serine protease